MVDVYRPAFVSQFGYNTKYDSENCVAASGCILLDRHTLGKKRSNPPTMRHLTDNPDRKNGLSLSDIQDAWLRGWDENLLYTGEVSFSKFLDYIREGRGGILFGDCRYKRGEANCPGPSGELPPNHAIVVNDLDNAKSMAYTYDPADHTSSSGKQWLSFSTLETYGRNWTQRNTVNAAFSKITGGDGGGSDSGDDGGGSSNNQGCAEFLRKLIGL